MCQHVDGRLVVDLSFDVRSRSLTWVLTGCDSDGQIHWLRDGHAPIATASQRCIGALADALAVEGARFAAHDVAEGEPFPH